MAVETVMSVYSMFVLDTSTSKPDTTSSAPAPEDHQSSEQVGGRPSPRSSAAVDVAKSRSMASSAARNGPVNGAEDTRV